MTKMMHDCLVRIAEEDLSEDPIAKYMVKYGLDPDGCRSVKVSLLVPLNATSAKDAAIMMADLTACLHELEQEFPNQAQRLKDSKRALDNSIALYCEHHEESFDVDSFLDSFVAAHS